MSTPGFSFTLLHFTFITHTLHYNTAYTHPWHLLLLTDTYPAMWPAKLVHTLASVCSKPGPKCSKCKESALVHTQTHTCRLSSETSNNDPTLQDCDNDLLCPCKNVISVRQEKILCLNEGNIIQWIRQPISLQDLWQCVHWRFTSLDFSCNICSAA